MKPINLYNSLTRLREIFTPIQTGKVGMYSCGPTVYNYPHIGNYRAYLCDDLIARVFQYNGYSVTHVMNITDVDDKTIRSSREHHQTLADYTAPYTAAFLQDLADLHISTITYHPKATAHITEMINHISALLDSDVAYQASDGSIYFSISKFNEYGKLVHLQTARLQADASGRIRNDEYSKDNVQDFALWKSWTADDGDVWWDSPFGKGRPGWHIECSAMSMKYLGEQLDIHAGGVDLLFPHHENEIAQSEAFTHKKFVTYWLHNEWLLVDGKKMAKSSGNFYTLRDILDKGYDALAYKFFCLSTHYRQALNFTFEALDAAQRGYAHLRRDVSRIAEHAAYPASVALSRELSDTMAHFRESFHLSINDDFNSPKALAEMFEFCAFINQNERHFSPADFHTCLETLLHFDQALGLDLATCAHHDVPTEIRELVARREQARTEKEWRTADELRRQIESLGYSLEDTDRGTRIIKV